MAFQQDILSRIINVQWGRIYITVIASAVVQTFSDTGSVPSPGKINLSGFIVDLNSGMASGDYPTDREPDDPRIIFFGEENEGGSVSRLSAIDATFEDIAGLARAFINSPSTSMTMTLSVPGASVAEGQNAENSGYIAVIVVRPNNTDGPIQVSTQARSQNITESAGGTIPAINITLSLNFKTGAFSFTGQQETIVDET
jgi:hypothetical protein